MLMVVMMVMMMTMMMVTTTGLFEYVQYRRTVDGRVC